MRKKLHLVLDESLLLLKEARELLKVLRERRPPDLYGPRGTEIFRS